MTTVACVFVRSDGPDEFAYTVDYVTRLHVMVTRWIDRAFRFVCLTDRPELMPASVEAVPVAKLPVLAPWTKVELFNPCRDWTGRVLYLDLDSLIVAPLAPILDVVADFAITADPTNAKNRTRDRFGRQIVRRFNSSVMVWDSGAATDLYTAWSPAIADRLSGDQDWIGEQRPDAVTLPRAWFPRVSELQGEPPTDPAKVVLCKVPKNHLAAERWPWVDALWRAV